MKRIAKKSVSILLVLLIVFSAAAFGMTASANSFLTINSGVLTYCNKNAVGAVEIPSTVTQIRSSAFSGCNAITEVTVPSSVTSIGSNAFDGCTSLRRVVIEGSNCEIGSRAFNSCGSLEEITLPSNLSAIEDGTFANCISLKSVNIPSTVTLIGAEAFSMCQSLTEMDIPASVKTIRTVKVNNEDKIAANPFVGCTQIKAFTVESGNTVYSSVDGVLYGPIESPYDSEYSSNPITDKALLKYPSGKTAGSFTVPSGVLRIGNLAFDSNENIKSIVLPNGLKSIEDYAFYMSAVTSVNIPSTVTFIGAHAFGSCADLKSITIPSSVKDFSGAFDYSGLTSVVISDGVETIGARSFESCSTLASVSIPASVRTIEYGAFRGCEALTQLSVPSSVTSIGSGAFDGCPSLTLLVANGSFAHTYAKQNSIDFKVDSGAQKTIKSIYVVGKPDKTEYYYKETIDAEGIIVNVVYSDDTIESIRSGFSISPKTVSKVGDIDVTVEYGGFTTSFEISASYAWWQWIIRIILLGFLWY